MNDLWFKVRGYVAAGVALVACPCHLVVTLPLLVSLTAGTALGAFLQQNTGLVFGVSAVLFVAGLYLALRWMDQQRTVAEVPIQQPRPRRRRSPAPTRVTGNGRPKVTLVHAPSCPTLRQAQGKLCPQAQTVWRELQEQVGIDYEEVEITTERGRGAGGDVRHHAHAGDVDQR